MDNVDQFAMSQVVLYHFASCHHCAGAAPVVRSFSTAVRVRGGHSVQLSCHVTGQPRPQITWFKNNDTYSPPSNRDVKIKKSVSTLILHGNFF